MEVGEWTADREWMATPELNSIYRVDFLLARAGDEFGRA